MDPRRCLSVVVPCFNEEQTIVPLLDRVLASPWVHEVVVVDDDRTSTAGTKYSPVGERLRRR